MCNIDLEELSLNDIMRRWPQTLPVFVELRLHCIGCPIEGFHQLRHSAKEHGVALDVITTAIRRAIVKDSTSASALRCRRR